MEQTPVPTAPLFNAFMHDLAKQLVPLIVAELKHQTQAEGMGMIALDPNNLSLPLHSLLTEDTATKDAILSLIEEHYDDTLNDLTRRVDRIESDTTANVDISDNDDFTDLVSRVDQLEEKVGELEEAENTVDADSSDFQDAVRSVIRNHI
jgi:hypothetical protein